MSDDVRIVLVTAPSDDVASALSRTLVEDRLCACVNRVEGLRSVYRWEGKLHDDGEVLMIIKTTDARVDALTKRVEKEHPYECPEVVVLPVVAGSVGYLDWVRKSVEKPGNER